MIFKNFITGAISLLIAPFCFSQLTWIKVDSLFGDLPLSVHVFKTNDPIDGKPNIAYYVEADLKDTSIDFTAEAADFKRYTPSQYYQQHNSPLLVVNCTFFNTTTGQNLNTVIKDHHPLSFNLRSLRGTGKDSMTQYRLFRSAIGINDKREADVAWLKTDSISNSIKASQHVVEAAVEPVACCELSKKFYRQQKRKEKQLAHNFSNWNMETAVGGGPVLVQKADTLISNNEERMFAGKARYDKHPRTAMGYTRDGKLIILVIQGRFPGIAEGADFKQEALILKDIGCYEALNLDGGGSSCLLVNGKETIKPSDKVGQRAVPAVFMIRKK
ncbi:MAG: phosphodiester glycosidase family protein [Chitinophagaceae bacterium]